MNDMRPAIAAARKTARQTARRTIRRRARTQAARAGFTLLQLILVVATITVLAGILMSVIGRGRATARRAQCDANLKAVAIALDAHRQENGRYPLHLSALTAKRYLELATMLRCPSDTRTDSAGYDEYYAIRSARDDGALPMLVCPLHENEGQHGVQAFKGTFTKQFSTAPAVLAGANDATVQSPGQAATPARANMVLRGGDRIRTGSAGAAQIRFADGSTSQLQGNSDVTLLQTFIQSSQRGGYYTLLRQTLGTVTYNVVTPNKFDVVTPTATAGALGTSFVIQRRLRGNDYWWGIQVTSRSPHDVRFSTRRRTATLAGPMSSFYWYAREGESDEDDDRGGGNDDDDDDD